MINFANENMKILIVEDEQWLSDSISKFMTAKDYLCEQAFNKADALIKVGIYNYDCVLLDLMLPDGSGLDVLRKIKKKNCRLPMRHYFNIAMCGSWCGGDKPTYAVTVNSSQNFTNSV